MSRRKSFTLEIPNPAYWLRPSAWIQAIYEYRSRQIQEEFRRMLLLMDSESPTPILSSTDLGSLGRRSWNDVTNVEVETVSGPTPGH